MASRETFYEVVFTQGGEEARVLVRAWSAKEAEASVRHALQAEGIAVPARLVARPARRSAGARTAASSGQRGYAAAL